jgi:outer membrane lipopolysaccharide assembly protein LptE/RlpB
MRNSRFKMAFLAGSLVTILSACGTTQLNMISVQNSTAKTLGLASSDEITISNVEYGQRNALNGVPVTYDATTTKGRRFTCSVFMIPGLTPINPPTYNDWECHPHT